MKRDSTLDDVRLAKIARDRAEDDFRAAVRRASARGHSLRAIAKVVDLSHTRIAQIVNSH